MERRKHERFSVNLNATLVPDQGMPIGCRLRDVSQGGLLIQCEQCQNNCPFSDGDELELRISLKEGNERQVIPLPIRVRRLVENGLAAEFRQPQSHLLRRLEPCFLDKKESVKLVAVSGDAVSETAPAPSSTDQPRDTDSTSRERRKSAIRRARAQFAATYTAEQAAQDGTRPVAVQDDSDKISWFSKGETRLAALGILSLVAAIGLVLIGNSGAGLRDSRIAELESTAHEHDTTLAEVSNRIQRVEQQAQELDALSARVNTLVTSMAALEPVRLETHNGTEPVSTVQPAGPTATAPAASSPAPSGPPASVTTKTPGPWVINLVSLNDKKAANRFTRKALGAGVPAVNNEIIRDGQTLWRVQVEGFDNRAAAVEYAAKNKQSLGLSSVWIYKQ